MMTKTNLFAGLALTLSMASATAAQEAGPATSSQKMNTLTEAAETPAPTPTEHPIINPSLLESENMLENGSFEATEKGMPVGWTFYPAGSPLLKRLDPEEGSASAVMLMDTGVAVLGIHSALIPVEPGMAYTLALEQKQEEIHIGFGMGGSSQIRWYSERGGAAQAQVLDKLDGSFGWRPLTYSFIAPSYAAFAQVTLTKRGAPGRVLVRNIRFAPGTLKRTREDLTAQDFLAQRGSFEFMARRLDLFLADKRAVTIPELEGLKLSFANEIQAAVKQITEDATLQGVSLKKEEESEVLWAEMLQGNQGFAVQPDSPYYSRWQKIAIAYEDLKGKVTQWLAEKNARRLADAMKATFGSYRGYAVGLDSPMLKILEDRPYTGAVAKEAKISLAKNEEESLQLTLVALEKELEEIEVEVSPLQLADGRSLAKASVTVARIDSVTTGQPQYETDVIGRWPDIVFPEARAKRVAAGKNRSFWVTVVTDAGTVSGDYSGTITLRAKGKVLETLPFQVRVWDVTIPKPGKFKVVGRFHPGQLTHFYGWKKLDEKLVADWNRYIFSKRWNSTDPFVGGLNPNGPALEAAVKEGMNAVNLLNVSQLLEGDRASRTYRWPDAAKEKLIIERLRGSLDAFGKGGGDDSTTLYVFGFDEQHDLSQYKLMSHVFNLVKKEAPEVRTITTTTYAPLDDLIGSVDTWVPLLGSDHDALEARRKAGDELFFYIYGHPFHPYPNASLIDYPGIDGRISFWIAANRGYTGFLHWLMNGWKANYEQEGRWPEVEWIGYAKRRNGEGYFLYPGPEGQPISSIRFELIRDGIEDWELIEMLREAVAKESDKGGGDDRLAQAKSALQKALELGSSMVRYTLDPAQLMAAREEVVHALIAVKAPTPTQASTGSPGE